MVDPFPVSKSLQTSSYLPREEGALASRNTAIVRFTSMLVTYSGFPHQIRIDGSMAGRTALSNGMQATGL